MEVYAGFLEFADYHTGRLIEAFKQLQVFDDTLIFYIIGDNGASGERTLVGTFNELLPFNGLKALETTDFLKAHIEKVGINMDEASRIALGRNTQRLGGALAKGASPSVSPRDRRSGDNSRGRTASGTICQQPGADADAGREYAV